MRSETLSSLHDVPEEAALIDRPDSRVSTSEDSATSGLLERLETSLWSSDNSHLATKMDSSTKTYAVIGASRGIGHEFVSQLLAKGHRLIATTRGGQSGDAARLWPGSGEGRCEVYDCDMLSEASIDVKTSPPCGGSKICGLIRLCLS